MVNSFSKRDARPHYNGQIDHPAQSHQPSFNELDDREWGLIAELYQLSKIPAAKHRGRPQADQRAVVNAVLWVLSTGSSWLLLPTCYPSPSTCRRRFNQWRADGTLKETLYRLASIGRMIHIPECYQEIPDAGEYSQSQASVNLVTLFSWQTAGSESRRRD